MRQRITQLAIMVLCAFYVQAQYTPGEKSGYYLRGNFNNSFDDNIGGQPQHEFLWGRCHRKLDISPA